MKGNQMKMRPGDRPQRWRSSHDTSAIIFFVSAAIIFAFTSGHASAPIGVFCVIMACIELRDGRRGWRMVPGMSPTMKRYYNRKKANGEELSQVDKEILESKEIKIMDEYCRKNKVYAFEYDIVRRRVLKG